MRVVLLGAASLLGLLAVGIGGLFLYQSIDREDTFVLKHASLADAEYLNRLAAMNEQIRHQGTRDGFAAASHRLGRGDGTILAYRYYSHGKVTTIDDEVYRKITIWLRDAPESNESAIDLNDRGRAVLVLSHGGSAWPQSSCSGYATSGTVRVTREGARYRIAIVADVKMQSRPWDRCRPEHLDESFEAAQISFEDLTPWLGLQGEHAYAETYR
jgi:hypothetical protein